MPNQCSLLTPALIASYLILTETLCVSGSIDGTVRCWDIRSRKMEPIQILDEARDGISSLKVVEHEVLTG